LHNDFVLMGDLNVKLQTYVNRSRTSYLNICIFMEHAHPSYAHIILEMSMIGTSSNQNFMANPRLSCSLFLPSNRQRQQN
jgi:hypothetical protein